MIDVVDYLAPHSTASLEDQLNSIRASKTRFARQWSGIVATIEETFDVLAIDHVSRVEHYEQR
jgi:hypothetical protein